MDIAILLFDGITALDAIGPYEVLSRLPETQVRFVANTPGLKRTDNGMLALNADFGIEKFPHPEIILIPGGWGVDALLSDKSILHWIQSAHETSLWTASVCTGSLVLGAANILNGVKATTHWSAMEKLAQYGAQAIEERYVQSGKIITSAGVSAGIDMALTLAAKLKGEDFAKAIQLSLEYDPEPPFQSGSLKKASSETIAYLRGVFAHRTKNRLP